MIEICICELFNLFISTQDNPTLRTVRGNSATTVIIKLFFASEYFLERILDRNSAATRVSAQETYKTESKRAKTVIRQLISKRRKHRSVCNLRRKYIRSCQ